MEKAYVLDVVRPRYKYDPRSVIKLHFCKIVKFCCIKVKHRAASHCASSTFCSVHTYVIHFPLHLTILVSGLKSSLLPSCIRGLGETPQIKIHLQKLEGLDDYNRLSTCINEGALLPLTAAVLISINFMFCSLYNIFD